MDAVSLEHGALHAPARVAHRAHTRVHVHADLPARAVGIAEAAPVADVVVLDDHIVRSGQQANRILLRAFQREAAHDDVRRADGDVVEVAVAAIDGHAFAVVEHITARRATLSDLQRLAGLHFDGACDWKALAPGAGAELATANLQFVFRAGLELHDAAAAFAIARVVPKRKCVAPLRLARFAELHRTTRRARIVRW